MTVPRIPVEVVLPADDYASGSGNDAAAGLLGDFVMLEAGLAASRGWNCRQTAVVLGVSRDLETEVEREECLRRRVSVLRRSSGGGTVVIGPGTLQWAVVFPHPAGGEPPSLDAAKQAANEGVRRALQSIEVGCALNIDPWGDLCSDDRKVGGLAIRRQRVATLVHGTLLVDADLDAIAALLKHPQKEPDWRRGRSHADFLAGLGRLDVEAFTHALAAALVETEAFSR